MHKKPQICNTQGRQRNPSLASSQRNKNKAKPAGNDGKFCKAQNLPVQTGSYHCSVCVSHSALTNPEAKFTIVIQI